MFNAVVFSATLLLCTIAILKTIKKEARKTMAKLDVITKNVAATRTAEAAAVVLLTSLKAELDAAIAASAAGDDGAALQSLSDSLATGSADLAAAVVANTPAAATSGSGATSNTGTPAPADLPDGHPLKPAADPAVPAEPTGAAAGDPVQS